MTNKERAKLVISQIQKGEWTIRDSSNTMLERGSLVLWVGGSPWFCRLLKPEIVNPFGWRDMLVHYAAKKYIKQMQTTTEQSDYARIDEELLK